MKHSPPSSYLGDHQLGNCIRFINGEHCLCCDFFQGSKHIDASIVNKAVQTFVSHNFFHFLDYFLDAVFTDHICTEESTIANGEQWNVWFKCPLSLYSTWQTKAKASVWMRTFRQRTEMTMPRRLYIDSVSPVLSWDESDHFQLLEVRYSYTQETTLLRCTHLT